MLTLWRTTPAPRTLAAEVSRLMNDVALATPAFGATGLVPPADVVEAAGEYRVHLDLPGVDPSAIRLEVEKDTLSVSAERRFTPSAAGEEVHRSERPFGAFSRSFTLPSSVDAGRVEARYEAGVLTVTLPKREEARARTIPVVASGR
jgi:HSP20 family protein